MIESTATRKGCRPLLPMRPDANRRRFLMFGATAAGAAAAVPVLASPAALVDAPEAKPASQGYQETEHVRNYYATTRI